MQLRFAGWVTAVILGVPLLLTAYALAPARFAVTPLGGDGAGIHTLVLLVHGSGGRDEPAMLALEKAMQRLATGQREVLVVRYTWSPWSDARLRTFPNGERVGLALGRELAGWKELSAVHVVGHSAGAYVLDPLCEALRAGAGSGRPVHVTMTFLDPIGFHGPLDAGWGARHFGRCADEAEAILNTDDPVPATAAPLELAWNLDVTTVPKPADFDRGGHRWPVAWYAAQLKPNMLAGGLPHQGSSSVGAQRILKSEMETD